MLTQPNILVCTDFSDNSSQAIKAAGALAQHLQGKVTVLHVSEHPVVWSWLPSESSPVTIDESIERDLMASLRKKLQEQLNRTEIKAESHIATGIAAQVILEEVKSRNINILVMGHKNKTAEGFRIGSLAEKIISASPVPVLVVKRPCRFDKIGALVDPAGEMEDILNWSEALTTAFKSRLQVLSLFPDITSRFIGLGKIGFSTELLSLNREQAQEVIHNIKENIEARLKTVKDAGIRIDISREKKLSYHLNTLLEEEKIDIAVMRRHQAGFFEKMLIGSETRRMIEIFSGNLFILPP